MSPSIINHISFEILLQIEFIIKHVIIKKQVFACIPSAYNNSEKLNMLNPDKMIF